MDARLGVIRGVLKSIISNYGDFKINLSTVYDILKIQDDGRDLDEMADEVAKKLIPENKHQKMNRGNRLGVLKRKV